MTSPAAERRNKHIVTAELVANVLSIEVAVGDRVTPTDTVCVLESMKMEIPVLAEQDGTIAEIVVGVSDVVRDGDPLVVLILG